MASTSPIHEIVGKILIIHTSTYKLIVQQIFIIFQNIQCSHRDGVILLFFTTDTWTVPRGNESKINIHGLEMLDFWIADVMRQGTNGRFPGERSFAFPERVRER